MDEKIKRLRSWMGGIPANPMTIELNPTSNCNAQCLSCWLREFKPEENEELSKDRLIKLVEEASELGVKEFRIPGSGEPLMKKGILDVLSAIKEYNMYGLLITNGTQLDENKIKQLVAINWDCITISLDSPDEHINDYLRGLKGYFRIVIQNLKILKRIKAQEKSELPFLRFNVVLSNRNYNKLQGLFDLAYEYGICDVQIQTLTVWGKEGEKLKLSKEEMKKFQSIIDNIKLFADKKGIQTNIEVFKEDKLIEKTNEMDQVIQTIKKEKNLFLNLPCFEPWYNMIILPDGSVSPCSIAGKIAGDNFNHKKLREIWFGKNFNTIRQNLFNNKLPEYCKTCCVTVHIENQRIKEELKKCVKK